MSHPYRQEVLNVILAQLLQERGTVSAPERIQQYAEKGRGMPDVIVYYNGLRTVIEGEVADQPQAHQKALASAYKRLTQGIAHISVAVVYPASLREVDFAELSGAMANAELEIAIVSEAGESGYAKGTVDYLQSALRHVFQQLIQEDVVQQAVLTIDAAVSEFAQLIADKKGIVGRMTVSLGIKEVPDKKGDANLKIAKISGLVLLNAMIFHQVLSGSDAKIVSLNKLVGQSDIAFQLAENWQYIISHIDYFSVFHIAREILTDVTTTQSIVSALKTLAKTASEIIAKNLVQHDLMGRIYHRLLVDAKYLGTYYTSIPAATLLLKLALSPRNWPTDWHDPTQVGKLRVSDLSCGTGTLLMAAAEVMTDNYIAAAAARAAQLEMNAFQKRLVEEVIYGYDVLPSALHLTASTLALRTIQIPFKNMNLFCLPLGGKDLRLGSIEFLETPLIGISLDLFGAHAHVEQIGVDKKETMKRESGAPLPMLDLCVMNPPFTRSVGGNLLFGSSPEKEREAMQDKLKKWIGKSEIMANITAGLGAIFVAVADKYIKKDGRIALVLPKALLSGVAWEKTRQLLANKYRVEYIVVSHDAERWNFSESTDLSETLLVAKKINGNGGSEDDKPVTIINLWRNPVTSFESLAIAQAVTKTQPPDLLTGQGALNIGTSTQKLAEAICLPWKEMKGDLDWGKPTAFAQVDLLRIAMQLDVGKLLLPGFGIVGKIDLCSLSTFGSLGPDIRDMHDGFEKSTSVTSFPAFWGHEAKAVETIQQTPNMYLSPLHIAKPHRHLRKTEDLWPLSATLLLAAKLRLNTQRTIAIKLSERVLASSWWTITLKENFASDINEKVLSVWFNSSLGFLLMTRNRVEIEGAWMNFKKPLLSAMLVLNLSKLSAKQLKKLAKVYDKVCTKTLSPFPQMATDPVRAEIDKAVADALDLPDFSILRALLAREPVVCMKRIG